MLHKTRGIVLGFVKYRESSIIVKIFTENFGLKSFIVNGVRSAKLKKGKIALYQPLTQLELVIYHRPNRSLDRISEARVDAHCHNTGLSFRKTTIAIFLAELLGKTLKEEEENLPLYHFVARGLSTLDRLETHIENFHLMFMLELAAHLGFAIPSHRVLNRDHALFDTRDTRMASLVDQLIAGDYGQYVQASGHERSQVLEILIDFYRFHYDNFGEIKSLQVLKELQQ